FLGACALLLLRREVIARRARNRAEKHIEYLAFYDSLTSLPNRVQFQERLAQLLVDEPHVALLLVDLDNFKIANDTYGHAAGDAVLRSVATTLGKHAQAAAGFAARLGGDEFAIVLKTENRRELDAICDAVFQDANGAFLFEGEALDVSLSIGIATKSQLHSNFEPNVDSLCRVTDFALYSAKADGRGRVTFYDQGLEQRFLDRRAMIDELPLAIEHGDLEVFLQPKVSLPKGEVYGFEALVRWRRNEALVSPDEFITISEESGLIIDIDRYMLNCATAIVAIYNAEHSARLSVSVNLSAIHFSSRRIIGWVKEALSASQLSPELLTLEITETVELRDWAQAQEVISALHKLGARISIDDFGTGYSSLGYLRNTMADEIKIDRSLVEQIETSEKARYLLDAVLNVAEKLDLEVVVEGVETELQADVLHAMGAKRAQGYLFGKPGESQRILSMVGRNPLIAANDASSAA
ncbi:MAG: EAL domain-containing protein, partial [Pseudomonadota bacterium]